MKGRKPDLRAVTGGLSDVPAPPSWLPDEAAKEWRRVVPDMIDRGILSEADMGSVEAYCLAMGQVRSLQSVIDAEGLVVQTDAMPRQHPAAQLQHKAVALARSLASELGLTPVSRSRPTIADPPNDDQSDWHGLVDG